MRLILPHISTRGFSTSPKMRSALQNSRKLSIVVSGISGRFPQSESLEEFKHNLLAGKDLLTEQTRFTVGKRLPPRMGMVNHLEKFDAQFFGVSDKIAHTMDPALRKLLEVSYEAIVDAGINPESLKKSNTGVFVGSDGGDALNYWNLKHGRSGYDGYTTLGVQALMLANQVSHLFDLKGTSMTVSTGCSSSLFALESAVNAIKAGTCERAIVAATCITLSSHLSNDLNILGALSPTGFCRPFDSSANGFVRGEAVVSILIEKKQQAKRNYAEIKGIRTSSDGMKTRGIFHPMAPSQAQLYRDVYKEADVDPGCVQYIETHGTGTQAGDPQELEGISQVFCKADSRKRPLLIGSVKSNMGHGEAVAALCSLAKVLIATQSGVIPRTLHFTKPNESVAHLFDGSIQVVAENAPYDGGIIGISSFGIGGTNSHVILQPNCDSNKGDIAELCSLEETGHREHLPILVPLSGRTEEGLERSLKHACNFGKNADFVGLLQQVSKQRIPGNEFRGFGLLQDTSSQPQIRIEKQVTSESRPVWLVFSGMGSQWHGMGKELLRIDAFRESFDKSRITLKNAGVDIDKLLMPSNSSIFTNIRDAFNSIVIMQIALYDTLRSTGISPNGFFGHSFGEILCAYADDGLTAEETLLLADARGRAMIDGTLNQNISPGGMAVVGLSVSEVNNHFPPNSDIVVACHNGAENVTISGSQAAVKEFVYKLQAEGIFALEVNSCNVAAHSPAILGASTLYLQYIQEILKTKEQQWRKRSSRWKSTSIPQSQLRSTLAQFASPDYFVNNFINTVLFHEAVEQVPKNAIVVEIAPQGLFQQTLKSSLPETCAIIAPMRKKADDRLSHFFTSVGDIYNAGADVDMSVLYPPVTFPVQAQTPSISPLIRWNHKRNWIVPIIENTEKYVDGILNIDLEDGAFSFLQGHKLDDRLVFPATGYLLFAWKSLAASLGCNFEELPVTFENLRFERAVHLNSETPTQLRCSIHRGLGTFEIHEDGSTIVSGKIESTSNNCSGQGDGNEPWILGYDPHALELGKEDIYKELGIMGYNFHGEFQSIAKMDFEADWASVDWKGNWVTFLDSVLQTCALKENQFRASYVPVRIEFLQIDASQLYQYLESSQKQSDSVPVHNNGDTGLTMAPGIKLRNVTSNGIQRRPQQGLETICRYKYMPYISLNEAECNLPTVRSVQGGKQNLLAPLATMVDLFLENYPKQQVLVCETFTQSSSIGPMISDILALQPLHNANLMSLSTKSNIEKMSEEQKKVDLVATLRTTETIDQLIPEHSNADLVILDDMNLVERVSQCLHPDAWIIVRDTLPNESISLFGLEQVFNMRVGDCTMALMKKTKSTNAYLIESICIDDRHYGWLEKLKAILSATGDGHESRVYIYSQNNPTSGVVGLVKCLRREPGGEKLRCVFDPNGELTIDFENPCKTLEEIIKQDLVMNVYENGRNGSFRHWPLNREAESMPTKSTNYAKVIAIKPGDLSSLRWIEIPVKHSASVLSTHKSFKVNYAALNFRDIMIASGRLPVLSNDGINPKDNKLGFEFSGMDEQGNRVMALVETDALGTSILVGPNNIYWPVPDKWTLEEAATVPAVYTTVYYGLIMRGNLTPGQTVLIHSGTGGVGQAAINLALSMNCEIFTTVGTEEKRKHIQQLFPSIAPERIYSSRTCEFRDQVLMATKGRGVDVVLNSLAQDKLFAGLGCLAPGGTFVEIGKLDIYQATRMGMNHLLRNVAIHGVDLGPVILGQVPGRERLSHLFQQGIDSGVVKPLTRTVFTREQVEDAFRFMAVGNHMGKVLVEIQSESQTTLKHKGIPSVKAIARSYFDPEKTFVIVGGLGGLGLEVADWMVARGARNLILVSRKGVTTGYQEMSLRRWTKLGVNVETPKVDLTSYKTTKEFIQMGIKEGKTFGGFFNSGLVIRDALLGNQTEEMFKEVAAPKIQITDNLDKVTREYCKDVDYFVVFSSLSAGLGNAGQSNYGLANSTMERICDQRRKDGLVATAIQWGVIGDVGYVAEHMNKDQVLDGLLPQKISSCLSALDDILAQSRNGGECCFSSMVVAEKSGEGKFAKKASLAETVARLCSIKVPLTDIPETTTLAALGLDSLSETELQQLLSRDFDCQLPSTKLRNMTWGEMLLLEQNPLTFHKNKNTTATHDVKHTEDEGETLVNLHRAGDSVGRNTPPLFIVHGGEGSGSAFSSLAAKLQCDVYAFQTGVKYVGEDVSVPALDEFAANYINEMKLIQPEGPYNVAGYSAGGSIALAIAQQLENKYLDQVSNLIVLDGYCLFGEAEQFKNQNLLMSLLFQTIFKMELNFGSEQKKNLGTDFSADVQEYRRYLLGVFSESLKNKDPIERKTMLKMKTSFETMVTLFLMLNQFKPAWKFGGKVSLIKARDSFVSTWSQTGDYNFQQFCEKPLTMVTVPGNHSSFLLPQNAQLTADVLNSLLFPAGN